MPTKLVIAQTTVRIAAAVVGSIVAKNVSNHINAQLEEAFGEDIDTEAVEA